MGEEAGRPLQTLCFGVGQPEVQMAGDTAGVRDRLREVEGHEAGEWRWEPLSDGNGDGLRYAGPRFQN